MNHADDPFVTATAALPTRTRTSTSTGTTDSLQALFQRSAAPAAANLPATAVARLHGFDALERPLLLGLPATPHELVPARTTQPLRLAQRGREVVVTFEAGDPLRPIILGVIEPQALVDDTAAPAPGVSVEADGQRQLISAEREVVLRCGDASITLTRSGQVLIRGRSILSRATGSNRIKGAAVDIN